MARAFVFPGQGSQAVGMGRELAAAFATARHLLEEVDDALNQKLSQLMFEGPESELTLTENAQPALLAVSLAVVHVLKQDGGINLADKAELLAGHSLGEYSAICAAGSLAVADAVSLVKIRGRAMQEAVPVNEGAMAALLGLDMEAVREVAEAAAQGEVCAPANDNAPGQIVVSGHRSAVERAIELAKEKGARRCLLLPVSAPFHSALMAPAADVMAEALAEVTLLPPRLPIVANVIAEAVNTPESLRHLLVEQVTAPVRWRESVLYMRDQGIDAMVELGAGKVLTGLTRRIDRDIAASAAGTPDEVEALLGSL
jgi:[acyl-carrier-protein] S-malonyltransferase